MNYRVLVYVSDRESPQKMFGRRQYPKVPRYPKLSTFGSSHRLPHGISLFALRSQDPRPGIRLRGCSRNCTRPSQTKELEWARKVRELKRTLLDPWANEASHQGPRRHSPPFRWIRSCKVMVIIRDIAMYWQKGSPKMKMRTPHPGTTFTVNKARSHLRYSLNVSPLGPVKERGR